MSSSAQHGNGWAVRSPDDGLRLETLPAGEVLPEGRAIKGGALVSLGAGGLETARSVLAWIRSGRLAERDKSRNCEDGCPRRAI
ncbi:MAG: hypothetical protein AAF732_23965 [Pseudomonadota bacterium]